MADGIEDDEGFSYTHPEASSRNRRASVSDGRRVNMNVPAAPK
jgi:hypothetical protein